MNTSASAQSSLPAELPSLKPSSSGWQRWAAGALSLVLLSVVCWHLFRGGPEALSENLPTAPAFYLAIFAAYMTQPVFDWLIFRRLWRLPATGLVPLIKKRVANDVLFNYSGEVYFYLWARQRTKLTSAPFGTVKDVSIMSALAGNLVTLALMAIAWPVATGVDLDIPQRPLLLGGSVVVITSLVILGFSRKIFSLPAARLRTVLGFHTVRLLLSTLLMATAWYYAMPTEPVEHWILFGALRLLVGRLPFIPSKDLLFAAAAVVLAHSQSELATVLALSAGMILAINLAFGLILSLTGLFSRSEEA
ncbi:MULTISPECIES: hypothetical protein [Pacificimonas]|uniref:Transmembrane protein n=1 Tax=Pacificimonas aurantium TaxID=1250540 RepID=A0ABS7WJ04_9SPHN|nr:MULTISPECIES: hypothetical protein [Pacificimonas]MBZ6378375.1 hypothetical protein [Pacificimonas aurantium]